MRLALGVAYRGQGYQGWQSQVGGNTVQDRLEAALASFADQPLPAALSTRTREQRRRIQLIHQSPDNSINPRQRAGTGEGLACPGALA